MNRSVGAVTRCVERIGIMPEKTFSEELLNKIKVAAQGYEKEFGTTNCTKIMTGKLGQFYSLADPEQYKAFIEAGGYVECPKVVAKIARITAEFILDYQEKRES